MQNRIDKIVEIVKSSYLFLRLPALDGYRRYDPVTVGPFQERHAGRPSRRLVVEVEKDVLVKDEIALLPLGHVGAALVEVAADAVLHPPLVGQVQQLPLADSEVLLHRGQMWSAGATVLLDRLLVVLREERVLVG